MANPLLRFIKYNGPKCHPFRYELNTSDRFHVMTPKNGGATGDTTVVVSSVYREESRKEKRQE